MARNRGTTRMNELKIEKNRNFKITGFSLFQLFVLDFHRNLAMKNNPNIQRTQLSSLND